MDFVFIGIYRQHSARNRYNLTYTQSLKSLFLYLAQVEKNSASTGRTGHLVFLKCKFKEVQKYVQQHLPIQCFFATVAEGSRMVTCNDSECQVTGLT